MTPGDARRTAVGQLLVGAAIIGTNGMMVRLAHMPPTISAFWRMALAAVILAAVVQLRHGWQALPARAWAWLLVPAVAFACDLWMWHRSILIVGPGLSTLLANAQVFFMALAGVLLFGERLSARFAAGVLLAFLGLWLLLGGDWATLPAEYHWGVWLGLATGVAYGAYNVGIKRTQDLAAKPGQRAPVEQVLCLASALSALLLGGMGLAERDAFAFPSWNSFACILALAAFGHCLAWVLISRSMARLPVALVGLLLLFQPIVAFLLDVGLLGRATSAREWLGLAVSLAGIFVAGLKHSGRTDAEVIPE